jgi:hypothetical protein
MISRGSVAEAFEFYSQSEVRLGSINEKHATALWSTGGEHAPGHPQ